MDVAGAASELNWHYGGQVQQVAPLLQIPGPVEGLD